MISLDDFEKNFLSKKENFDYHNQMKIKIEIIELFITYREEHNLTQKDLANFLGLKQQSVSRLERDEINPTLEFLAKNLYKMGYELKIKKLK